MKALSCSKCKKTFFSKLVGDKDGGDEAVRQLDSSGYLAIPPPNPDGAEDGNSQDDSQDASFMAAYGDQTSKEQFKRSHATSQQLAVNIHYFLCLQTIHRRSVVYSIVQPLNWPLQAIHIFMKVRDISTPSILNTTRFLHNTKSFFLD